ncbi:hypothetical protein QBC46DRAFT_401341 [Diplogelasinospora grovesii]|uniref:Uncharacterized protein n=1 Tax=Diplogelasinospora grovesii TaxID=303347 RepID=A0AAN6MVS0_9PEZI|nr:hypothetical protein QBC46DRAFT_401341 [Diplogelasinospora grovesii]
MASICLISLSVVITSFSIANSSNCLLRDSLSFANISSLIAVGDPLIALVIAVYRIVVRYGSTQGSR